jgi:ribose transport system substrate-binding protein
VLNGNNDPSTQSSQFDTVVSQGIKVVILDPVVKDALVPATKRAVAQGVKVIAIDRTVNTPVLTTIKAPDVPLAEKAAQRIADQLHGHGNVAILSGTPGASPTIDRTTGFMNVMKNYPGIHVVANVNGNYDTNQGFTATKDLLSRFARGQLDWIFSEADVMSFGAIKAVQGSNRGSDVKIGSIDGQNQGMDAVAAGTLAFTVVYPLVEPMNVAAAAKACAGEAMPQSISLLYPLVTKENVATYKGTQYS